MSEKEDSGSGAIASRAKLKPSAYLPTLIKQVQAATGPDRGLDSLIWRTVIFDAELAKGGNEWIKTPRMAYSKPPYTASIDAALALAERMLPGWKWVLEIHPTQATAEGWFMRGTVIERSVPETWGKTAPLAIISALLHALDSIPSPTESTGNV